MLIKLVKAVLIILCFCGVAIAEPPRPGKLELDYFFTPTCHVCHEVREKIISQLEQKYKDKIQVNFRDISTIEEYKLLLSLKEKYRLPQNVTVPVAHFSDKFLNGKQDISTNLIRLIDEELAKATGQKSLNPSVDLLKYFFSFTPLAVVGAGLVDGVNPCAFTVIVFFISFLALQGYRKKELAVVGLFFIFAVFATYLLIGLGIFSFFYSLKGFWLVRKSFNLGIGSLSLLFGIMAAADFIKFRSSGQTEGMKLQLPLAVKKQIQKVIGLNFRKDNSIPMPATKGTMFRLSLTALVTGFLVSLLEAVCTGQMYLPTITFVLKSTNIRLKALGYLLLYNLMFILPLLVIFFCALMGTTSEDFSRFLKRHFLSTKFLMAVMFFVLGIYLIWRA
jgi:cytochrome c biogenesis protein CcdA